MPLPVIAIVGRPNVGKSTLFNRLSGRRIAIVSDTPGTTRDRVSVDAEWHGSRFLLIDTAGIEDRPTAEIDLWEDVRYQTQRALESADAGILVVDLADGITSTDYDAVNLARRSGKPLILAANKADNRGRLADLYIFNDLGVGEPTPISAYHNTGIDDLMQRVFDTIPSADDSGDDPDAIRVTIAGRPNVGKSALFNALTGDDRAIVSHIPGTTRDTVNALYSYNNSNLLFLDTAGLRRRGKTEQGIEKYSAIRTIGAIEECDVAIIVLDASEFVTAQDTHIAGFADNADRAGIFVINKWDLTDTIDTTQEIATDKVRDRFKFIPDASIIFTSALTGEGVDMIPESVIMAYREFTKRVDQSELAQVWLRALGERPLPGRGTRRARIQGIRQIGVRPPSFVISCRHPELIHFSYRRYLENRLRSHFGFQGSPIRMIYRSGPGRRDD